MHSKNKFINITVYNICVLIQSLTKLDVEFLDKNDLGSFQLFNSQMPSTFHQSKVERNKFLDRKLRKTSANDFLYYTDNYQLSYLGVGIWNNKSYSGSIIVGPFLSDVPNERFISNVIELNKLPIGHRQKVQQYYKLLPILDTSDFRNVGSLMVNVAVNPLVEANLLTCNIEDVNTNSYSDFNEVENEKFYIEVELRYQLEKEIQNAVAKGSIEELQKVRNKFQFNVSHRVSNNPLRAQKNLAFVVNTLLRIAAERGGVSPINIHNISEKYSILIEKVTNLNELEKLIEKMQFEYCDSVNKLSTVGYSPMIRKAIDYINFNFHNKLSLNSIAEKINISPTYLSRQFKKETGFTITGHINKKRIEEAKFLIKLNSHSITEIALMVGFENHNYFSTVFKQITSLTPKEYLMT